MLGPSVGETYSDYLGVPHGSYPNVTPSMTPSYTDYDPC